MKIHFDKCYKEFNLNLYFLFIYSTKDFILIIKYIIIYQNKND